MIFAIQDVDCGNIFFNKQYSNKTVFYICNEEYLIKGFFWNLILVYCSGWNRVLVKAKFYLVCKT